MHCQREQIINRFLISYLFYVHDGTIVHVQYVGFGFTFYVFLQFYVLYLSFVTNYKLYRVQSWVICHLSSYVCIFVIYIF